MGLFDKLFTKNKKKPDPSPSTKNKAVHPTSKLLDEIAYWKIVDESLKVSNTLQEQEAFLINRLQQLSVEDIIGFRLRTDQLLHDTYTSEMWCAAYIMNEGCPDDMFEYFRNWVISRGKETYYLAKENPDTLVAQFNPNVDFFEFEEFWTVANEAFGKITNLDLYDYIAEDFKKGEGHYPEIEFTWDEDEPETLQAICPKLFDVAWV